MSATYDEVMASLGLAPSGGPGSRGGVVRDRKPRLKSDLCGRYSGYVLHKERGEDACERCLEARRIRDREYHAANRERLNARRRELRRGGAA